MRNAFSMFTAIFVIIIMAVISSLVLSLSGKITKETSSQFRQEQAALLARSYTELAIMAVMNHNRNATNCIEDIDGVINGFDAGGTTSTEGGYSVETRIYYLGNDLPCPQSRKLNDSTTHSATRITTNYNDVGAPDAIAAVIIDVYVSHDDPDVDNDVHYTYHRRTLQKI